MSPVELLAELAGMGLQAMTVGSVERRGGMESLRHLVGLGEPEGGGGGVRLSRGARYKRSPKEERTWNGRVYDSKHEMRRAQELHLLARVGKIHELREQVSFELIPKAQGQRATMYRADFVYVENGQQVVEDAKGHQTEVYRIKKKLMRTVHGITIREV